MSRRHSTPNYQISHPGHYYYDTQEEQRAGLRRNNSYRFAVAAYELKPLGSFDSDDRVPPGYGVLETATLQSEISMSVVTDDTRFYQDRRPSLLRRLAAQSMDQGDGDPSRKGKCSGFINVEPVMFLLSCSLGFFITSQPLFTYWARCYELADMNRVSENDNITMTCAQLASSNGTLQDDVEKDISRTKIYLQIASSIPTLIIAPIIGTWSDKRGRRYPLLLCITGWVLFSVFQLIATVTYTTMSVYTWFYIAEIQMGLCGGISSMFATTLAIVTDDCRHKLKPGSSTVPLRIGIVSFLQSVGSLVGTFIVSLITVSALVSIEGHSASYVRSAIIQLTIAALALVYAIIFVRETHFPQKAQYLYRQFEEVATEPPEVIVQTPQSALAKMKHHLSGLCEVLTERRAGWTRLCLNLSLLFVFVEFIALDNSLLMLLVKRRPFSWSDKLYSQFALSKSLLFAVGMVACPLLLTRVRWLGKDSLMIMAGIGASSIAFFLTSFAATTTEIFITCGMALIVGGISPGYRSFLPRMVPKEQTARMFTIVAIIMSLCPILSNALFNSLFNVTLGWWPGFAFFIGGIFQVVAAFGQLLIHFLMRPQWLMQKQIKDQRKLNAAVGETDQLNQSGIAETPDRSTSNTTIGTNLDFESLDEDRVVGPRTL